jgi:2-dehydropantoate 2-reductase
MEHVLFYGSGAVNIALMGWMNREGLRMTVLARPASAEMLREHGVRVKCQGLASEARPDVVTSLAECPRPDLIVIGVKSYALDVTVADILKHFDREVPVLSVLNGVRHVDLLRSKFSNAMFATICFNAYRTEAWESVAISRGPLVFTWSGGIDKRIMRATFDLLKGRVEAVQGKDALDVAYNKLIVNLANALMTMVAFHDHRDRQIAQLQRITSHIMWEAVQVLKASGINEQKVPGLPTWRMLWMSRYLPQFVTVPIFRKKMTASAINSMAQDMQRGNATELEDINGALIRLAQKMKVKVPYNRGVYELFKEWSAAQREPMTPSEVLSSINSVSRR